MYYFIVNPESRSGNGRRIWQIAEEILEQEDVEYRVFFTSCRFHAGKLAAEITGRKERVVLVAVGGDGTVNEVLNGIQDFSKVTFGYIPTGSSNDFARTLGLPTDTVQAVKNILHPSYFRRIDLGRAYLGEQQKYFAVSCGCGFDAAVCHEAVSSRMKGLLNRLHLGKLTYIGTALKQLLALRPSPVKLVLDDGRSMVFRRTYFAAVMNCCFEGGGLKFCPDADTEDGFLDICVVEGLNKAVIALMFPTAFYGLHRFFPGIHLFRVRSAEIYASRRLPFHTDGEPYFLNRRARIACVPQKLTVIAGPR